MAVDLGAGMHVSHTDAVSGAVGHPTDTITRAIYFMKSCIRFPMHSPTCGGAWARARKAMASSRCTAMSYHDASEALRPR